MNVGPMASKGPRGPGAIVLRGRERAGLTTPVLTLPGRRGALCVSGGLMGVDSNVPSVRASATGPPLPADLCSLLPPSSLARVWDRRGGGTGPCPPLPLLGRTAGSSLSSAPPISGLCILAAAAGGPRPKSSLLPFSPAPFPPSPACPRRVDQKTSSSTLRRRPQPLLMCRYFPSPKTSVLLLPALSLPPTLWLGSCDFFKSKMIMMVRSCVLIRLYTPGNCTFSTQTYRHGICTGLSGLMIHFWVPCTRLSPD
jgi:hypothetical protein